jgi:SAM-dependent methyltransferase
MTPLQHLQLLLRFDRTLNLRWAIGKAIRAGDRVLDAGCGLGLMAIWSAMAGASQVVAVDIDDVSPARELAAENGLQDRIDYRQSDLTDFIRSNRNQNDRFDVIIAMVYLNDPRRDEQQSNLVFQLRDYLLKPDGRMVPDRVVYRAALGDWPQQDFPTRQGVLMDNIQSITDRYAVSFDSLGKRILATPYKAFFPDRLSDGSLLRNGCRQLARWKDAFELDYRSRVSTYPGTVELSAEQAGLANVVLWRQELFFDRLLIFANESISWLARPAIVKPRQRIALCLDSQWREQNVFYNESPTG